MGTQHAAVILLRDPDMTGTQKALGAIVDASPLTWRSTAAERDGSAPSTRISTGGTNIHRLRPLLPGIWLSIPALIYTSHSAATTCGPSWEPFSPCWRWVGASG